jgi:phage tail-like protein
MAGQEYLTVSTYEVKIDNLKTDNFIRVSGIGLEVEDIRAKDESGKHTVNTPGSTNARDLTLTRRFSGDKGLFEWLQEVKTKGNLAKSRTGSIRLLNNEQKQVAQFDFDGSWIKSWYGPELSKDSSGNTILTETAVLSVNDIKMV